MTNGVSVWWVISCTSYLELSLKFQSWSFANKIIILHLFTCHLLLQWWWAALFNICWHCGGA